MKLGIYFIYLHGLLQNFANFISLDHPPANNKSEIFAPLNFAADAPARRLCPW